MVRNTDWLRISALSALFLGVALAGCNSQTSNPDNSPGAPITPVKSTTAAPGNNRSDDNMPGNAGIGNHGPGTNMPGNHMPNDDGTGTNMPGNHMPNNNGTGNTMPGKGMGGMGGNR